MRSRRGSSELINNDCESKRLCSLKQSDPKSAMAPTPSIDCLYILSEPKYAEHSDIWSPNSMLPLSDFERES